jgi:guanyl-specific ribonuclease Sa
MVSKAQLRHRGRLMATAVAVVLTVAGVVLAVVAIAGQQHPGSPSASAANPARERSLAPAASPTTATSGVPAEAPAVVGQVLPRSAPVRLDVPGIGVRGASLVTLGLAKDRSIEVPPVGANSPAGWFNGSPTPGQLGPSIILGHVDSATAGPGIFYRLSSLRPGDTAMVTRDDHTVAVFQVDSVEEYAKSAFPTLQVFGNTDHAALRLITCGGKFNPAKASYESNIVVYAHLVSSHRA